MRYYLILFVLAIPGAIACDATLTINPAKAVYKPGEQVTVSLKAEQFSQAVLDNPQQLITTKTSTRLTLPKSTVTLRAKKLFGCSPKSRTIPIGAGFTKNQALMPKAYRTKTRTVYHALPVAWMALTSTLAAIFILRR